ncbi:MAG: CBS domain-containing protein [Thermodesulfobacteriota bacterium]
MNGARDMGLTAADIMSREVITVTPRTGLKELAEVLSVHRISGVPVLEEDRVVGIVSQSDLVAQNKKPHVPAAVTLFDWVIYLESMDRLEEELKKMAGTKVGDIMSRKVISVTPRTPLEEVATIMAEKKVHTIPVLEEGRLVGVIGKLDIVRSLLR